MSGDVKTRRRATRFLGPWPFQPALTAGQLILFFIAVAAGNLGQRGLLDPDVRVRVLVSSVVLFLIGWAVLRLGRLWQDRHGVRWGSYFTTIVLLAGLGSTTRVFGLLVPLPDDGLFIALRFGRSVLLVLVITTLTGLAFDAVERQVTATKAALEIAREQQVQIITTDEEARRQVAVLLHDRVQSGLLGTCLELREIVKRNPGLTSDLQVIQDRLEEIRSVDVRSAARVLSPNLTDVDLQTAIEDLAAPFGAAFTTEVSIEPNIEKSLQRDAPLTALAVYRILDQALLNIAAHADATEVHIEIDKHGDEYSVTVRDNGIGLPNEPVSGLGFTIITTWVRATDGSWRLSPSPGGRGGCTLRATLGARLFRPETATVVHQLPH